MSIVPVLLQPRLLTIKNRWLRCGKRGLKELLPVILSLGMMYGIYASTLATLNDAKRILPDVAIDPTLPLSVMLGALSLMIYLSAAVAAIGSLFLSKDLDLITSAPASSGEILFAKTCEVGLSVSWMACVFGLPGLLAFGAFFNAGPLFIITAPLLCLSLFAVAITLGMITALVFAALIPSERGRSVFISLFLFAVGIFLLVTNVSAWSNSLPSANPIRHLTRVTSLAAHPWLPTSHCAHAITALMKGELRVPCLAALESMCALVILGVVLKLVFTRLYDRGLSRARATGSIFRIHSRAAHRLSSVLLPFSSASTRAIMAKEYKVFSRDLTHTVQLVLLLGMTFLYLYNYQMLRGPSNVSDDVMAIWQIFLLLTNIALGSLVVTSICSRFVYPSVSLEGQSFWLLQAAPLSIHEMLKAKRKSWTIPISCIGAVIFISGAMALDADVPLVLASCAAGIIICHGLVGLGIGLGAFFSQFEWEHSTQISTSFGSFIFMMTSMIMLSLTMVPLGCMFGTYLLFPETHKTQDTELLVLGVGLLCTYLVNKGVSWWALSTGARALQPK
jgi:ABC-2 type transport system permease protein